jgi:hypothetical protein
MDAGASSAPSGARDIVLMLDLANSGFSHGVRQLELRGPHSVCTMRREAQSRLSSTSVQIGGTVVPSDLRAPSAATTFGSNL